MLPISSVPSADMTATTPSTSFPASTASGGERALDRYWGKQGRELLDRRLPLYKTQNRMVFGANAYREFAHILAGSIEDCRRR